MTAIRYTSFPLTEPPPDFVPRIVQVFHAHETEVATTELEKGLTSDKVLGVLAGDLLALGFDVEQGKTKEAVIDRPVFFGEGGVPTLRYRIDAYHDKWRCGLEVEAGRAWMGNAVYRDLVQALVMVQVDNLVLAVANQYKYRSGGKPMASPDYDHTVEVARALYGHSRVQMPYGLTVLGY